MSDDKEYRCAQFLRQLGAFSQETWGFHVYGTYTLPANSQSPPSTASTSSIVDETLQTSLGAVSLAQKDSHFHNLVATLHSLVSDDLRIDKPEPYNHQLIDKLRLRPAAYMPGASLADVCTHFQTHHAVSLDDERLDDPLREYPDHGKGREFCLVITDDALAGIEAAALPRRQGGTEAEGPWVVLLSRDFNTMEPEVLASSHRGRCSTGSRCCAVWQAWLRLKPDTLFALYQDSDYLTFFRGTHELLELTWY